MTDSVALVGIVVIVLWLASLVYYFRVSNQHKELHRDVEALKSRLPEGEEDI
jgi:hypothetical protein